MTDDWQIYFRIASTLRNSKKNDAEKKVLLVQMNIDLSFDFNIGPKSCLCDKVANECWKYP